MLMKRIHFIRMALFALMSVLMLTFAGCNLDTHNKNDQYVSDVRRMVNDSVTYTRKLRQQDEIFDCKNNEMVRGYLLVTDDLINTLQQIQKLKATDRFDDMDTELKLASKDALGIISQLKALVVYAQLNGNDMIYQLEKDEFFNRYYHSYDNMVELSSAIQTMWRNA